MADHRATALPPDDELDESLWDSPAKPTHRPGNGHDGTTKATGGPRPFYEDNETREAALRQELASVRKVNEAMEDVLQNLERAKTNMKVWKIPPDMAYTDSCLDRQQHGRRRVYLARHMDSHSISNRTQSTADPGSELAGHKSRHG